MHKEIHEYAYLYCTLKKLYIFLYFTHLQAH